MLDFFTISSRSVKKGVEEIFPKFIVGKSNDLMIRGGDFFAVFDQSTGMWSRDEQTVIDIVDRALTEAKEKSKSDSIIIPKYMWDSSSGSIDAWHKYCKTQMRESYKELDTKITFADAKIKKTDYISKKLNYSLNDGPCESFDKLIGTLYSPEERHKLEWAIGSIVAGDSKNIQKLIVLYGDPGTGKSTILNIISLLFADYCTVFDAKSLGSSSSAFPYEDFKTNPIVAIQHDADLSRIEDNTRLNSLISHETVSVNEKFKQTYTMKFNSFLFIGTNRPVKITEAKSGLIRRLIDVNPSGNKVSYREYKSLMKKIEFELGAIAKHCLDVYLEEPGYYDNYVSTSMLGATNDFYNFVDANYFIFKNQDGVSLKVAFEMYNGYCNDARVQYPMPQRLFREELKNYFDKFVDRYTLDDGTRVRSYYLGFKEDKFEANTNTKETETEKPDANWIAFNSTKSLIDDLYSDCPAQLANKFEKPLRSWSGVTTTLKDIDTSKVHYLKMPEQHIVIDFDIPDDEGKKSLEANLKAASMFPKTYAELSKSGSGIHLHYIYDGDASKLNGLYAANVEIKVFNGNSSLRRKLTKCNDIPVAHINSGLPIKEERKVINKATYKSAKKLEEAVYKGLNYEVHDHTKPSMDFIYYIFEEAYNSGLKYDLTRLKGPVYQFACRSTNQSDYCKKLYDKIHFKSDSEEESVKEKKNFSIQDLTFFDIEVYKNLLIICYKLYGDGNPVHALVNPSPDQVAALFDLYLAGYNCLRYDNTILLARVRGESNEELFRRSQRIVNGDTSAILWDARNISTIDIYDMSSVKQSLKKFEIELGIPHKEWAHPWDEPVPDDKIQEAVDYCKNDVLATEKVFISRISDFTAREILADVADMSINTTTNNLTTKIIFGDVKDTQRSLVYRNLAEPVRPSKELFDIYPSDFKFRVFDKNGDPLYRDYIPGEDLPEGYSIMPFFPGYTFDRINRKSLYLGEEIGEGGRVYAEPGMYTDIWDGDVASMHPHSIIYEWQFGKYTQNFKDIVDARIAIKHKDFESTKNMLGGKLSKYLDDEKKAKDLAQALKIAINSVYGLTAAKFQNPFKDPRNVDNITAKRGALFMTKLKHKVEELGYKICHIKTDSIKIPNADKKIIDFVINFGIEYGYTFETEADYEKFTIVNDAVYIAKDREGKWTATGAQFAVPYVYKNLFSHEKVEFSDLCEAKQVKSELYLDRFEKLPEGEHDYQFIGRIGLFCPMKPGNNAGTLLRLGKDKNGNPKYDSVTGAKGYLWMEADEVKERGLEDQIDYNYFNNLINNAKDAISQYGDFEWFAS